jgi:hypothetical protein
MANTGAIGPCCHRLPDRTHREPDRPSLLALYVVPRQRVCDSKPSSSGNDARTQRTFRGRWRPGRGGRDTPSPLGNALARLSLYFLQASGDAAYGVLADPYYFAQCIDDANSILRETLERYISQE